MKFFTPAALAVLLTTFSGAQQKVTPAQIVDQFYPQKMLNFQTTQGVGSKVECFKVYDQLPDGTPNTIMAGYADGFVGQIDVIQHQPSGNYQIVSQPSGLAMNGTGCSVELHDVDGDGIPEVWYGFANQRGREGNWVFKWDGAQLTNLSPTGQNSRIGSWTKISNGELQDIYHDGTLQIYSVGWEWLGNALTGGPDYLYRYSNGVYVQDLAALANETFSRSAGKPAPDTRNFQPTDRSTGPYVLKITNGDKGGANRVSSAQILVNGTQIFGPSDFNKQVEFLSAPLTNIKPGANTLSVELNGAPGTHLIVLIQDQTPALQSPQ